jgi:hypothetical protein
LSAFSTDRNSLMLGLLSVFGELLEACNSCWRLGDECAHFFSRSAVAWAQGLWWRQCGSTPDGRQVQFGEYVGQFMRQPVLASFHQGAQ